MSTQSLIPAGGDKARQVAAAHERLREAAASGVPCAPVRDLIGSDDVDAAYAVQMLFRDQALAEGRTISGRKIGLTSPAVQKQLGVDRPDFGLLFADMSRTQDEPIDIESLLQPRIEAEIAFVLGADLDGEITDESVRAAVDHAVASFEIVASRISRWDISLADTIADNASSGLYVLGSTRLSLSEFEPKAVRMQMSSGGATVSSGTGADCLGDPLLALAWLARAAAHYGSPLRAGHVVLSGALGPMVAVTPGSSFTAEITELGTVTASFTAGEI